MEPRLIMQRQFATGGAPRYRLIEENRVLDMMLAQGWAYEVHSGHTAHAMGEARAVLERWINHGLPCATTLDGERRFDIAEVVNFMHWSGRHLGDPAWEDHFIATARRLVTDMPSEPTRFTVKLEREFNLAYGPAVSSLRLRLPLPLEEGAIHDLRLTVAPPVDCRDVRYVRTPGRLDAVVSTPLDQRVTFRLSASFVSETEHPRDAGISLKPDEFALYTQPAEGLVQATPRISALAAKLADRHQDSATVVEGFWRFMVENLAFGAVRYDQIPQASPLDWMLDEGGGDCQLGSALLVALCRSRGIPARICSGYFLYPIAPTSHYWSEIWLPPNGWLPFDLAGWGLSLGGRDTEWLSRFYGRLDHRYRTQCFPRLFTGTAPVRFPAAWQLVQRPLHDGVETGYWDDATGDFVFIDRVAVSIEKATPLLP